MPGPLEGFTVVELGLWVAGPSAGAVLADWGARVGKIEPHDGVLVTNMRPAALARLGFDWPTLSARYPRLVYGLVTGYGERGPDAERPSYDVGAFWSRAGIAAALTPPGGDPPFQRGAMGDHTAGMTWAGGISAALLARTRSGRGQLVSTSLLRVGVYVGHDWEAIGALKEKGVIP